MVNDRWVIDGGEGWMVHASGLCSVGSGAWMVDGVRSVSGGWWKTSES